MPQKKPAKPKAKTLPAPIGKGKPRPAAKKVAKKHVKASAPLASALLKKDHQQHPPLRPLTETDKAFIANYLVDPNATQAYLKVKPNSSEPAARVSGARMLAKPNVAAEIAAKRAERSERLEIDGDKLVQEVYEMALADTRELVAYEVTCCRHCFGEGYQYQRTQAEMDNDREEHEDAEILREEAAITGKRSFKPRTFREHGGVGYDGRKDPNPECTKCWGRGVGRNVIKDTRKLGKAAVALYAGVKESKDGLELLKHDKRGALDMMWRHQGLYEIDNAQKGVAQGKTKEELAVLYEAARVEAESQRLVMLERSKQFEKDDQQALSGES